MRDNQFHLLRIRRFLPLFVTQFLGALNDNLFKNALVILILYRISEAAGLDGQVLVTVAAGAFLKRLSFSAPRNWVTKSGRNRRIRSRWNWFSRMTARTPEIMPALQEHFAAPDIKPENSARESHRQSQLL